MMAQLSSVWLLWKVFLFALCVERCHLQFRKFVLASTKISCSHLYNFFSFYSTQSAHLLLFTYFIIVFQLHKRWLRITRTQTRSSGLYSLWVSSFVCTFVWCLIDRNVCAAENSLSLSLFATLCLLCEMKMRKKEEKEADR